MPKRKLMSTIDRQIEVTKRKMDNAQKRYDKLANELIELNRERAHLQAETILDAMRKSGKSMDEILIFLNA